MSLSLYPKLHVTNAFITKNHLYLAAKLDKNVITFLISKTSLTNLKKYNDYGIISIYSRSTLIPNVSSFDFQPIEHYIEVLTNKDVWNSATLSEKKLKSEDFTEIPIVIRKDGSLDLLSVGLDSASHSILVGLALVANV